MNTTNFFVEHGGLMFDVARIVLGGVVLLLALIWTVQTLRLHLRQNRRRRPVREIDTLPRGLGLFVRRPDGRGGWERVTTLTDMGADRARATHKTGGL